MSLNKILNSDDRRVVNKIREQSRFIRELKTPQKVGADILAVQSLPTSSTVLAFPGNSGTYTMPSGSVVNIAYAWFPNQTALTLWNFLVSVYLDPTSFTAGGIPDPAHLFPTGGSLSNGALLNVKVSSWIDWATSSDTSNARRLIVNIVNNDSGSHTVTVLIKAYLPNLDQIQ